MREVDAQAPCPCGWGEPYAACCGRYHAGELTGEHAPTAEALMRSRYSAFVREDEPYLLRTWDPATRPAALDLTGSGTRWRRLLVLATTAGGPFDDTGTVEFEAHARAGGRRDVQHEVSAFRRAGGRWFYTGPAGGVSGD
ncbi:YchJ family protein [Kineococcus esterisolvens]|uniref:YchJ family protein n=1 Tax=unclassified Kineococcus TaxID=2621656 RepID=UPI003D7C66D3